MSIEKKFVIIDEIMDQLEAAKSGVVPGSVSQSIVSGIQNVPSSIIQGKAGGGSSASCYTTFPLSPIIKNCCLDKSYLNFEFDINYRFSVELAANAVTGKTYTVPFWFGLRDTASMFNQIQVLIENTAIWSTVYQREESVIAYNALPETEIRGNNQYSSIEKMMNATYSPMKRVIAKFNGVASGAVAGDGNINNGTTTGSLDVNMHFKCTVDLNRITPLISNLHYTTPHMGNLRLKVFLQEFEKCLFFCPDYGYRVFNKAAANAATDINSATKAAYNKYLPLIYKIVNQFHGKSNLPYEELFSSATLGFVNAMNSFGHAKKRDEVTGKWVEVDKEDRHTNYTFGQYVGNQIRNQILGGIEDSHLVRIPKSEQKKDRKEKGYNAKNNTVSGNQTVGHDNEGNGKTLFDYIENSEDAGKSIDNDDL